MQNALLMTLSLLAGTAMLMAAWSDITRYLIPNRLAVVVAISGLVAAPLTAGLAVLPAHLLTGLGLLVAGALLYALRVWGAGDAKLLAAAGCWAGPSLTPALLWWTAILGGGLALVALFVRFYHHRRDRNQRAALAGDVPQTTTPAGKPHIVLPYGVAIAGATVPLLLPYWLG